jgi:hypothetical protein
LPRPILIHIGYHKTGSGWLRRLFFVNPETGFGWIGKSKPSHPVRRLVSARPFEFDAAASRAEFDPLLRRVESKGLLPVVAFERLVGHPFSGGYDSKEIADRLAATFPEGRVLVVLREQRSMILSTYKQYVRQGGALPLARFLEPPQPKSMPLPWFDLAYFEYHHLLDYYRRLFGPDAVLALTYEQFCAEPAAFVADIARFAGRPPSSELLASLPFETRSNASPSAGAIELRRRLNRLGWVSEVNPAPVFTSAAIARPVRRLAEAVDRATFVPRRVGAASDDALRMLVEKTVGDRYTASNRVTAELSGIDLAALGWTL